jgi:hypothetical protein
LSRQPADIDPRPVGADDVDGGDWRHDGERTVGVIELVDEFSGEVLRARERTERMRPSSGDDARSALRKHGVDASAMPSSTS